MAPMTHARMQVLMPGFVPLMEGDLIHEGKAAKGRLVATNHCNEYQIAANSYKEDAEK